MTSGNDRNDDPARQGQEPNWWQGAPAHESQWQPGAQASGPQQQPGYGVPQGDQTWQYGYAPVDPTTQLPGGSYGVAPGAYPGQGYQGTPYQTGPYQTGGQPPGGGKGRGWLFAGIGALAVALVGAVVTVVLVSGGSDSPAAQSNTTPSLISALTTEPSASGRPTTTPRTTTPRTTAPSAVIPGYQVVSMPELGAAYDVPKDWTIDTSGISALDSGLDRIPVVGLAQEGIGYCTDYTRTTAFLSQSAETDPAKAAADIGVRMARIGWPTTTGSTPGAAEPFSSSDGTLTGVFLEIKGSAPAPTAGCASTYTVYTFAFPAENGAFVLTIGADTGVDRAVDRALAQQILASIRATA
ncbi:hypothetical protein JK358_04225 [Nocardia sp. 2]|uniref:DUF8017 domain-containing protein n=1 Tax=Nocardia acididurans TaxID=2802282 RepID=A0ABS1LZD8_9NOCA|nr:hypothetical protein [Nocardia acididurans]MBL1073591.1 hypothetical protein [Nocardia acididurans]